MRLTQEQPSNGNYHLTDTLKPLACRYLGGFLLESSAIAALVGAYTFRCSGLGALKLANRFYQSFSNSSGRSRVLACYKQTINNGQRIPIFNLLVRSAHGDELIFEQIGHDIR